MRRHVFLLILFLFIFKSVISQTFSGVGANIPDDGTAVDFTIQVQNLLPATIDTANFGLESVCINLTHTYDSDLDIRLVAPDGTETILTAGNGADGDNYLLTCFNGNATNSIIAGQAPFNGTYRPQGTLGLVNNGQNANAEWTLHILDTYPGADQGALINWSITFGNNPSTIFTLNSSNIPIVIINSGSTPIPDEPKITAQMGIIDNGYGNINHRTDPFNGYNGYIGIEIRGSSSQMFPKKSYGFETRDSAGNNLNVHLLGMPSENDWTLIANYSDKTLMHNSFTYDLARKMGYWAPRNRFCEIIVNNEYMGVYALTEEIKRDNNRVNIASILTSDTAGDALTGGYIIKIDKWTGSNNDGWTSNYLPIVNSNGQTITFQYHYPKADDITLQQKEYIQSYVDTFETVLNSSQFNNPVNGYYKFIDINSFIDYFIINEISKNVDGYRLSAFLYKDRKSNGGKLTMGPVWDYDIAYHNVNYCGGDDFTGWAYKFGDICSGDGWQLPFWWDKFITDSTFVDALNCRWQNLRTNLLDTISIFNYIDSIHNYIDQAQTRNFNQWPILGIYVWPNPSPYPQSYTEEVNNLKKWFRNRLEWLDNNIPGICLNVDLPENIKKTAVIFFPNPASTLINIRFSENALPIRFEIEDLMSRTVQKGDFQKNELNQTIALNPALKNGQYFLRIYTNLNISTQKLLILKP